MAERHDVDVVVVGAGFAGLRALHRLREIGLTVRVFEAGSDIGGVWNWNRYPGARCDVESADYSYSFSPELDQEWTWSERYATQPEILRYVHHVADRFDLRRDIRLGTRVVSAVFDEAAGHWTVGTGTDGTDADGTEADGTGADGTGTGDTVTARYLVLAVGCLSATRIPRIAGLERFTGTTAHTGDWPAEGVDVAGKRVAVIGTGSSGTQAIPLLAEPAAHLTVFQRTPNFSVPARNAALTAAEQAEIKAGYPQRRAALFNSASGMSVPVFKDSALEATPEQLRARYEAQWGRVGFGFVLSYADLLLDRRANETAADFLRGKIREIVREPATADALCPTDYPFGAKRPCVDSGYFETFNRDDVTLVDVREEAIEEITATGVRTANRHVEVDVIVFATGYDAMTGSLLRPDIRGRGGVSLRDRWAGGPLTYLGLTVSGFPNMFIIAGPGSPSVLTNVIVSIEQHVEWLADLLAAAHARGAATVEATPDAERDWVEHVGAAAARTLYPQANSWYLGGDGTGPPRVFMPYVGGVRGYRRICEKVAQDGYTGLTFVP